MNAVRWATAIMSGSVMEPLPFNVLGLNDVQAGGAWDLPAEGLRVVLPAGALAALSGPPVGALAITTVVLLWDQEPSGDEEADRAATAKAVDDATHAAHARQKAYLAKLALAAVHTGVGSDKVH